MRKTAQMLIREDNRVKPLKMDFEEPAGAGTATRPSAGEESKGFLKPMGVDVEGAKMKVGTGATASAKRENDSIGESEGGERKKRKKKVKGE